MLSVLTSSRHAELSPKQLVPQLVDEGVYLASEINHRLQRRHGLRRRRRPMSRTPVTRSSTVHRASAPNKVWSWDITWLPTKLRSIYLHLYLVMDVWSRRIVGWKVADRESAELAAEFITEVCRDRQVDPRGLVLHSDNGKPMRGSTMVSTLQWLGVVPSFSRPHVSDDNPYSESQFKTMKYRPDFPQRFGCIEDARAHCQAFFPWYNTVHRHSGIGYMTPHSVHHGHADAMLVNRQATLDAAFLVHPNRFKNRSPQPHALPTAAWINPPPQEKHPANNPQPCTVNS